MFGINVGLCGFIRGHCGIQFEFRDRLFRGQRSDARQVLLCLAIGSQRVGNLRLSLNHIGSLLGLRQV